MIDRKYDLNIFATNYRKRNQMCIRDSREGRPTEHATLTARLIDRPIRPLFAEGFRNEVQIVNTVLSCDPDASSEMASLFGSSLALCISDIPFNGPVAGVMVARVDGEYIINPSVEQEKNSDLNVTVAGTKNAINMVEAGAKEVSEEDMLKALMIGHDLSLIHIWTQLVRIHSYDSSHTINRFKLVEGRMPENDHEVVAERNGNIKSDVYKRQSLD